MRYGRSLTRLALVLATTICALCAWAAEYPAPSEGAWVARDFRFHTGEVMPELHLDYRTIGAPTGEPVLVLHGTAGSGASMLTPAFAGELFGAGQPLDASRYYIIIPDTLGHGKSSKPSDGLRTQVPEVQLRRHGRRALPAAHRAPQSEARARGDRQLDGRHGDVDLRRRSIRTTWTSPCRWRACRPKCRAATGCCVA